MLLIPTLNEPRPLKTMSNAINYSLNNISLYESILKQNNIEPGASGPAKRSAGNIFPVSWETSQNVFTCRTRKNPRFIGLTGEIWYG